MKSIRCMLGRHKWGAKAVREGDRAHVLAECERCGGWWASVCFMFQDHSTMMPSNWFPVSSPLAVELWSRAVTLGKVETRERQPGSGGRA